jgi:hypothetical protein
MTTDGAAYHLSPRPNRQTRHLATQTRRQFSAPTRRRAPASCAAGSRGGHGNVRLDLVEQPVWTRCLATFGSAAGRVAAWTARLRREGLVAEMQFATSFRETGSWGDGVVLEAAEEVFAANSRALAMQFGQADGLYPQVSAAANFVSIAAAFASAHGVS